MSETEIDYSDVHRGLDNIEEIVKFRTTDYKDHASIDAAEAHQIDLNKAEWANVQLANGASVGDILVSIDRSVNDDVLFKITRDTKLVIGHWQCSDKPGYRVSYFLAGGGVYVHGHVGLWGGGYGEDVKISDLIRYAKHKDTQFNS